MLGWPYAWQRFLALSGAIELSNSELLYVETTVHLCQLRQSVFQLLVQRYNFWTPFSMYLVCMQSDFCQH